MDPTGEAPSLQSPTDGVEGQQRDEHEFDPALHSWILVPEHDAAHSSSTSAPSSPVHLPVLPLMPNEAPESRVDPDISACSDTFPEDGSYPNSPPVSPVLPTSLFAAQPQNLPSQDTLSQSVMEEGDTVAALMISEILGGAFPITPTESTRGGLAWRLGFPTHEDMLCRAPSWTSEDLSQYQRYEATQSDGCDDEGSHEHDCAPLDDDGLPLPRPLTWARYLASQPLAFVAVLLASHAAAFLLGLAMGRGGPGVERRVPADYMLQRRFSSGPYGYHARLCLPA